MKRDSFLAMLFPDFTPVRGLTEEEAMRRLEKRAWEIVKGARWVSLSNARINELRQPLLEIYLARRAKRSSMNKSAQEE